MDPIAFSRFASVTDRSRTLGDAASIVYAYSVNNDKETWVRTDALKADGQTYNSAYEIFDSLLRWWTHSRSMPRRCQVPEPRFHLWAETWQRVRQAESRRDTTGDAREWAVKAAEAEQRLRETGLDPEERFPGSKAPWTVRCRRRTCRQISRIRYADFITGASGCRVCAGHAA